jgi:hypothetical protein
MAFSKFKAHVRAAAARTIETLWQAATHAIDKFTTTECANFFAQAGYAAK